MIFAGDSDVVTPEEVRLRSVEMFSTPLVRERVGVEMCRRGPFDKLLGNAVFGT